MRDEIHSRRRKAWRPVVAVLVIIALVAGGGSVAAYSVVRHQVQDLQNQLTAQMGKAQADLEAAKASLRQANANHDVKLAATAKVQFTAAGDEFHAAAKLADGSQLLSRLETLPDIGPMARTRHTAVDGIAGMGASIADAGLGISDLVANLIQPKSAGGQQGTTLLTVLQDSTQGLVTIRSKLVQAQASAASVDESVLSTDQRTTFARAKSSVDDALASIDAFNAFIPVLTDILGGNGPRTYLIEQLNPAELRPGGGFIGTYSILRADHGQLKLVRSGSSTDLASPRPSLGERGYVAPPGPLKQLLISRLSWSFFDSNFFPDFPSNALSAERFAQPHLGMQIDGVIAIDYYTVAKMLELTGPVPVPGFGLTLNYVNFIPIVFSYDLAAYTDPTAGIVHKAILNAVAGPLMERLSSMPPTSWGGLIAAFNGLATQRHIQTYFNNKVVEAAFERFAWTGVIYSGSADEYMMEVEANVGATKANYYVTRSYTVALTRSGNVLHHRITVDITNNMPYVNRPNDFYRVYANFYVGANASSLSDNLTPMRLANNSPPSGTRAIDGWATIAGYGNSRLVVFSYDTPWHPSASGVTTIYWQKQPGTGTDAVQVTWTDGAGHTYGAKGDLGQDRVITLSANGVTLTAGHQAQAQIPTLNLG